MTKEEKIKEKYMLFQNIQQQLEQLTQHMQILTQQNEELNISINAMDEISQTQPNNEILAPIANGIFLKTKLQDNKKFVVNVGSNITVERTVEEVKALLEQQQMDITAQMAQVDTIMEQLSAQAMEIYQEVQKEANQE